MYLRLQILALLLLSTTAFSQLKLRDGVLNAAAFDFASGPLSLQMGWRWVDGQLVNPENINLKEFQSVEFPKVWNETRANNSGQGVATYSLLIALPSDLKSYAIELPQIYSSYKLWANGDLIAVNGTPDAMPEKTRPQWKPQTVTFNAKDSLRLLLQIANFHHNIGGCREPIYLGDGAAMLAKERTTMVSKVVQCVTLLFLGIIFFAIYFLKGRKKVIVYFSLLCATWTVRSAFSNEYLIISIFPNFNWHAMVRIEYITLYLTMIWAILFLNRLFPKEGNKIIKYILVTLNCIFIGITLFTQPVFFTQYLTLYLATAGLLLAYGIFIIARALINNRLGAGFLTVCALLGLIIFGYDIFTYEGLFSYNSVLFNIGYVFIFVLIGLALLLHLRMINLRGAAADTITYNLFND